MSIRIISYEVKNIPWMEQPDNLHNAPIWRYNENPIIKRNPVNGVARIFNSGVIPYKDQFIGVFRGEQLSGIPHIYLGRSRKRIRLIRQEGNFWNGIIDLICYRVR